MLYFYTFHFFHVALKIPETMGLLSLCLFLVLRTSFNNRSSSLKNPRQTNLSVDIFQWTQFLCCALYGCLNAVPSVSNKDSISSITSDNAALRRFMSLFVLFVFEKHCSRRPSVQYWSNFVILWFVFWIILYTHFLHSLSISNNLPNHAIILMQFRRIKSVIFCPANRSYVFLCASETQHSAKLISEWFAKWQNSPEHFLMPKPGTFRSLI